MEDQHSAGDTTDHLAWARIAALSSNRIEEVLYSEEQQKRDKSKGQYAGGRDSGGGPEGNRLWEEVEESGPQ